MFTHKQYLDGGCTHRQYYGQFVTDLHKNTVLRYIGLAALKASKDAAFNDIPLQTWDALHPFISNHTWLRLQKEGLDAAPVCLGTSVCLHKEAARQILESEQADA